ncbi:peptidoglycan DD-metalloendopeptidase family protein [Erysipelothrix inopinata]|uniref:Peptidoglycan DD-metalloendopeptidase family protein n=1 Tax=Erysipelothrix inopinata TaxID=225084 RepID=A0A7G9S1L9_9FIRM|nr:peptidoglycan DD-metalloendopeptidase family protein [Erysipelothrix inopinata]QNN61744.1 peptidoglycan DD-metalloendopeptidase family protein [Erysipelothrix inopinata]
MKKKRWIRFLVALLLIGLTQVSPQLVEAETLTELCTTDKNDARCQNFKKLTETKANLDDINKNLDSYAEELTLYQQSMVAMQEEITQKESGIEALNESITKSQEEIQVLDEKVTVKKDEVAKQMVRSQSTMRVNNYFEFLFDSRDFADIIRRIEAVNIIQRANREVVNEYHEALNELNTKHTQLETDQATLIQEKETLEKDYESASIAKENIGVIVKELMVQKESLMIEEETINSKVAIDEQKFQGVTPGNATPAPSGGRLSRPLATGYWVSAGVWSYPWGGTHLGVDLAPVNGNVGMNLLAPGNGIVVGTHGGCPTWGSYGSRCNGGYGNYMNMIVSDGVTSYGILYAHLMSGSFTVPAGTVVQTGDVVGRVGSSGSSTGPHVHAEAYNLGNISIQEAYSRWNGSNTFSTGSASSNGLNHRCSVSGVPCRENPQEIWNYQYGASY